MRELNDTRGHRDPTTEGPLLCDHKRAQVAEASAPEHWLWARPLPERSPPPFTWEQTQKAPLIP